MGARKIKTRRILISFTEEQFREIQSAYLRVKDEYKSRIDFIAACLTVAARMPELFGGDQQIDYLRELRANSDAFKIVPTAASGRSKVIK